MENKTPPAPVAVASSSQPSKVITNPLVNMGRGFMKFVKTNLLMTILFGILFSILIIAVFVGAGALFFTDATFGGFWATLASIILLTVFITPMLYLILSKLLLEGVRGHKLSFNQSLRAAGKFWIPIVYTIIIILIIVAGAAITGILSSNSYGSGSTAPAMTAVFFLLLFIVSIILALRWCFVFFTVVDYPDSGVLNSLKRSSQLTSGYRGTIFLYIILAIVFSIPFAIYDNRSNYTTSSDYQYRSSECNDPRLQNSQIENGGPSQITNCAILPAANNSSNQALEIGFDIEEIIVALLVYAGFSELYRQLREAKDPLPVLAPSKPTI
jgi:hypothetical protein